MTHKPPRTYAYGEPGHQSIKIKVTNSIPFAPKARNDYLKNIYHSNASIFRPTPSRQEAKMSSEQLQKRFLQATFRGSAPVDGYM